LLAVLVPAVPAQRAGAGRDAPAAPPAAQPAAQEATREARLDAQDHAQRLRNRALVGDIGAPVLPPVRADSPRDDIRFADRFPFGTQSATSGDADLVTVIIPAAQGGTGTPVAEIFEYQLPDLYDHQGTPHPMVIGYHGYGSSAQSVALKSTLDEECNARNWVYMAPTGLDDQVFGTSLSQQNTEKAIEYMLENFNVDPDRLYMVGFSMGAGVCASFASQHRDPDGLMIAAVGSVCGTYDWTMAYSLAPPTLKTFMENQLHFGGNPATVPFEYQRWSTLHFDPATYPPIPGTVLPAKSMGVNLGQTPTYLTWDTTDPNVSVTKQGPRLVNVLEALGGTLEWKTVASTFDPDTSEFAPHSWLVLDEADLFDFFDGKVVDRTPDEFRALVDGNGPVSWLDVTQRVPGHFSALRATAQPAVPDETPPVLATWDMDNCSRIDMDVAATTIDGTDPVEVTVLPTDGLAFKLVLRGAACPPVYLLDKALGTLVPETDHDPLTGELETIVTSGGTLEADAVCEPDWTTIVWTEPKTPAVGAPLDLTIDAPAGTTTAWTLVGFETQLATLKGLHLTVEVSGALLLTLPLDVDGDLFLAGDIPNAPALSGLDLLLQVIGVDAGSQVTTVSNMWILEIQ
jgi:predicted esterase